MRRALELMYQEHQPVTNELRVISWNLLRLTGASTSDVANLIEQYRPDLLLMQEAARELVDLADMVGGHVFHSPLRGRVYGLAVWSAFPLAAPEVLPLPVSTIPGRVPVRVAQIVKLAGISFANVHLSHGQFLNRWQLLHLVRSLDGPAAIVGDYNAIGQIRLAGLRDVGPREPTHVAGRLIPFRLDRCMVRGLSCRQAQVLDRGTSDHRPIMIRLGIAEETPYASWQDEPPEHAGGPLPANLRRWLLGLAQPAIWHAMPDSSTDDVFRRGRKRRGRLRLRVGVDPAQRGNELTAVEYLDD